MKPPPSSLNEVQSNRTENFPGTDKKILRHLFLGSLLLAVYEIALTHQASGFFKINFAFFSLVAASSGLGLGAMLAALIPADHRPDESRRLAPYLCGCGLSCGLAFFMPVIFTLGPWPVLFAMILAQAGPFILWGICLGVFYRHNVKISPFLFSAMTAGSAVGIGMGFSLLAILANSALVLWILSAVFLLYGLCLARSRTVIILACLTVMIFGWGTSATKWDTAPIPKWHTAQTRLGNFLSTMVHQAGKVHQVLNTGDADSRIDLVGVRGGNGSIRWLFKNGSLNSIMVNKTVKDTLETLKAPFPLAVLPFKAASPKKFLSINAGGGLDLRLAQELDIPTIISLESEDSMRAVWDKTREYNGDLPKRPGITIIYEDVRKYLDRNQDLFDLIRINLNNNAPILWTGHGIMADFNSTLEAFTAYWNHLEPGGIMAIGTANEIAGSRAFCQLWEVMERQDIAGGGQPRENIWAFKAPQGAAKGNSNNFLILARKGEPSKIFQEQLDKISKNLSAIPLYSPGQTSTPPYAKFANGSSSQISRTYLTGIMRQKTHAPLDFSSATDKKPFFFQLILQLNPFIRWALGIIVGLLLACLLIPLPKLRPLNVPGNDQQLPIPVFLSYFIFLGAGIIMTKAFLVHQAVLHLGSPETTLPLTLAMSFAGLAIGSGLLGKIQRRTQRLMEPLLGAIILLLITGLSLASCTVPLPQWDAPQFLFFTIAAPLFMGICLGPILPAGLRNLAEKFPSLSGWAFAAYAIALSGGVIPLQWLARLKSWDAVGIGAGGCLVVVFCLQIWLWQSPQGEVVNNNETDRLTNL